MERSKRFERLSALRDALHIIDSFAADYRICPDRKQGSNKKVLACLSEAKMFVWNLSSLCGRIEIFLCSWKAGDRSYLVVDETAQSLEKVIALFNDTPPSSKLHHCGQQLQAVYTTLLPLELLPLDYC